MVERQLPKLNVEGSIPFTRFSWKTEFSTRYRSTQALVDLHVTWYEAQPDQGHDAEAARWQAMLNTVTNVVEQGD